VIVDGSSSQLPKGFGRFVFGLLLDILIYFGDNEQNTLDSFITMAGNISLE